MEEQKISLETVLNYLEKVAQTEKALGDTETAKQIRKMVEHGRKIRSYCVDEEKLAQKLAEKYCKETCQHHPCYILQKKRDKDYYWNNIGMRD